MINTELHDKIRSAGLPADVENIALLAADNGIEEFVNWILPLYTSAACDLDRVTQERDSLEDDVTNLKEELEEIGDEE